MRRVDKTDQRKEKVINSQHLVFQAENDIKTESNEVASLSRSIENG